MSNVDLALVKELREKTSISMSQCIKALGANDNNIDEAILWLKKNGTLKGDEKAGSLALEGKVMALIDHSMNVAAAIEVNCQTDFNARSSGFAEFCKAYAWYIINNDDRDRRKIDEARLELAATTGENIVIRRDTRLSGDGNEKIYFSSYNHPGDKLCSIVEFGLSRAITAHDTDFHTFAEDVAMQVAANAPKFVKSGDIREELTNQQITIFQSQLMEEGKPTASWDKIIPGKLAKWRSEVVLLDQPCLKEPKTTIDAKRAEVSKMLGCEIEIRGFTRYALGETSPKQEKKDLAKDVSDLIKGDN